MTRQATALIRVVLVLWLIEVVDQLLLGQSLDQYGIRPRQLEGLRGVLLAPFLHRGFGHLAANTLPLLTLGWLAMLGQKGSFVKVTVQAIVLGGIGVWVIGRPHTVHIGASGLIFAYLGYLLLRAWFERSLKAIAIAVAVGLAYGGLLWGLLPNQPGVSWEAHLCGFLAGALIARMGS